MRMPSREAAERTVHGIPLPFVEATPLKVERVQAGVPATLISGYLLRALEQGAAVPPAPLGGIDPQDVDRFKWNARPSPRGSRHRVFGAPVRQTEAD